MAWLAFASAARCRRVAAWARNRVLSARVIAGLLSAGVEGFEGRDDPFQVRLDLAEADGQPGLAVCVSVTRTAPAWCSHGACRAFSREFA
jgi:hypothetical protein